MAFTTREFEALLSLLEGQPESRAQLRTLLFPEGLETLPERFSRLTEIVERLAEAQQRTEERLERLEATVQILAEAQQRTEERLQRLETTVQALAEAQQRTEARLEQLAEAQQRTETRLEQLAEAQQRTEARLEQLAEAQQRTEARLEQLAEAQQRTEARLEQLAEAQQRTEARLEQLAEAQQRTEVRLEQLAEAQQHTEEQVRELVRWQHGEAGRRRGERYEHRIARRGWTLFRGGEGGVPDQPAVQQRLSQILEALPAADLLSDEEADPFLADLIWWKNGQFVVVEASLQVNGNDVARAARRAETLQRANVEATGVVVGQEWAEPDTRRQAEARGVHWWVGDEVSEGLVAFRRLT